jgi:hypothetical protein
VREVTPQRPPVQNKRVWASLEKTPEEVLEEAFVEGLRRDPGRNKTWVGLVDGNAKQLEVLEALARKHAVQLTLVMDIIHVVEYLWDASVAFHDEASVLREQWVTERLLNILCGNAAQVAAGMRRSATLRSLSPQQRRPVDAAARYLLNHQQYMRYDQYLAAGLPIATGVIEGACRHLVADRMDGVARWSLKGAEAVLRLRALRSAAASTPTGITTSPRNTSATTPRTTPTASSTRSSVTRLQTCDASNDGLFFLPFIVQ